MSDDQLKDFVEHLHGNHTRRMSRERDRGQDTELRQVMSDWYETSLCNMSQEAAIKALVEALAHPDVSCKVLASKLSTIYKQVGQIK